MVLGHIDSKAGVHYPIIPAPTDPISFWNQPDPNFRFPSRCNNPDPQVFICSSIKTKSLQKERMCLSKMMKSLYWAYLYVFISVKKCWFLSRDWKERPQWQRLVHSKEKLAEKRAGVDVDPKQNE